MISDKNYIRIYALAWIAAYLAVYFFFKDYLPDEYFRDSLLIQQLAVSNKEADVAFRVATLVTQLLPEQALVWLVAIIGSAMIWIIVNSLRTMRGMVLIVPILAPFLVLNVMAFGKETFVIPLSYLVLWIATKWRSTLAAFAAVAVIYVLYGIFFREYYLMILAIFAGCIVFRKLSGPLRIVLMIFAFLSLFLVPSHVFTDIQSDRDEINFYANQFFMLVHTAIYNPLPPDSAFHFIVNYFYAAVRLTLPFFFRQEVSDWILFFNVLFYGYLIKTALKHRWNGPLAMLPLLFIAHVLVLFIFEPDLGSYLRHASSVMLYLLPALRLVEQRHSERIRRVERKEDDLPSASPV